MLYPRCCIRFTIVCPAYSACCCYSKSRILQLLPPHSLHARCSRSALPGLLCSSFFRETALIVCFFFFVCPTHQTASLTRERDRRVERYIDKSSVLSSIQDYPRIQPTSQLANNTSIGHLLESSLGTHSQMSWRCEWSLRQYIYIHYQVF